MEISGLSLIHISRIIIGPIRPERMKKMPESILKRLAALMSVKSVVTLVLTGVFAYLAVTGQIAQDFMTVYAVVIAFYFGTQSQNCLLYTSRCV